MEEKNPIKINPDIIKKKYDKIKPFFDKNNKFKIAMHLTYHYYSDSYCCHCRTKKKSISEVVIAYPVQKKRKSYKIYKNSEYSKKDLSIWEKLNNINNNFDTTNNINLKSFRFCVYGKCLECGKNICCIIPKGSFEQLTGVEIEQLKNAYESFMLDKGKY
ncbi:MAG: hypothetical protein ABIB46_01145 [bacterium]